MLLRRRRGSQGRCFCSVCLAPRPVVRHVLEAALPHVARDVVEAAERISRLEAYVGALGKGAGGVRVGVVGVVGVFPLPRWLPAQPRCQWVTPGSCIVRLVSAARASVWFLG